MGPDCSNYLVLLYIYRIAIAVQQPCVRILVWLTICSYEVYSEANYGASWENSCRCIDSCAELFLCLFVAASKARHHDRDILWRLKSVKTIPDYEVRAAWSRFLQSLELVRSEDQVSYGLNKYVPIVNFMFCRFLR